MASSLVSTMSRQYSSVFNQSGFLTAGSILDQRQDLNSILFSPYHYRPPAVRGQTSGIT